MPFVPVPDKNSGDVFTTAMWTTYLEGNLNAGVERPIYDSGILGASTSAIDILSIPATFAHLRVLIHARTDSAANFLACQFRINNLSTGIYDYQTIRSNTATVSGAEFFNQTSAYIGDIPGSTAAANCWGGVALDIYNYTQTANHVIWTATGFANVTNTSAALGLRVHGGAIRNLAAINRLTFLTAANFIAGSRLTLLGVPYI